MRFGKTFQITIGVLITAACLLVALWGVDSGEVVGSFRSARYSLLPIFLGTLFAFYWLKAMRWKILLKPLGAFRTKQVFGPLMIGFMANNLLPAHLGELVRTFVFSRDYSVSRVGTLSTIVLERVFDVICIFTFLGLALIFVDQVPAGLNESIPYLAAFVILAASLLIIYLFWSHRIIALVEWLLSRFTFIPRKLAEATTGVLESGAQGFESLRQPRLVLWLTLTSFLQWGLMGVLAYIALWSLGISVGPSVAFVVIGVTAVGVTVPSSPGYFGVIQLCFWLSLQPFGVGKADAFAASVYFHIAQYIPVTLVGIYFLNRTGLRLSEVGREVTRASSD